MLVATYKTKSALKQSIGKPLQYEETTMGPNPEYKSNGTLTVVGPGKYERKWWAQVTMSNDTIKKVS